MKAKLFVVKSPLI